MEKKKTGEQKKSGWDEANQVLTDNFGNVYDFGGQTLNGIPCKLTIHRVQSDGSFSMSLQAQGSEVELKIHDRKMVFERNILRVNINRNYVLTNMISIGKNTKIMHNDQQQLNSPDEDTDISFLYNNNNYQGMNIIGEIQNLMTGKTGWHQEYWLDNCLVSTTYNSANKATTMTIYPKQTNENSYSNNPVFQQIFTGGKIEFLDKQGDLIYFFSRTLNNTQGAQSGRLYVYNAKYNEIITRYEVPELPYDFNKIDDLKNVVELMHQKEYKKDNDFDFCKALSKYLKCKEAKYNMNTPSRAGLFPGG